MLGDVGSRDVQLLTELVAGPGQEQDHRPLGTLEALETGLDDHGVKHELAEVLARILGNHPLAPARALGTITRTRNRKVWYLDAWPATLARPALLALDAAERGLASVVVDVVSQLGLARVVRIPAALLGLLGMRVAEQARPGAHQADLDQVLDLV